MVPAVLQRVWVLSAAYADPQTPSSPSSTDVRVPAQLACDDELVLQMQRPVPERPWTTADDRGVGDKLSAEPGTLVSTRITPSVLV